MAPLAGASSKCYQEAVALGRSAASRRFTTTSKMAEEGEESATPPPPQEAASNSGSGCGEWDSDLDDVDLVDGGSSDSGSGA